MCPEKRPNNVLHSRGLLILPPLYHELYSYCHQFHNYSTRYDFKLRPSLSRTSQPQFGLIYRGFMIWNALPPQVSKRELLRVCFWLWNVILMDYLYYQPTNLTYILFCVLAYMLICYYVEFYYVSFYYVSFLLFSLFFSFSS